jgi:hypothetical protein
VALVNEVQVIVLLVLLLNDITLSDDLLDEEDLKLLDHCTRCCTQFRNVPKEELDLLLRDGELSLLDYLFKLILVDGDGPDPF